MIRPPPLPREHGAWAMLAIPLVLGLTLGGRAPAAWLVTAAVLAAFLSHYAFVPVLARWRAGKAAPASWTRPRLVWGTLYLGASGAAAGAALAIASPEARGWLVPAGAVSGAAALVYFVGSVFDRSRALAIELTGLAGMSLTALLPAFAASVTDRRAFSAAAVSYAYALSSVAFVRACAAGRPIPARTVARCALVHFAIVAGMIGLRLLDVVLGVTLVALAPVVVRTTLGLLRPPENLRRLGRREIPVAVLLLLLAAGALAFYG